MRPYLLAFLSVSLACAQDPKSFAVMAWGPSPTNEQQLRDMREAGLNISGFCRTADLEKVRAAGLTCFVQAPAIDGINWLNPPAEGELRGLVRTLRQEIGGNPAALGVFLRDEPNAQMMPGLGKVSSLLRESIPPCSSSRFSRARYYERRS